MQGLRSQVSAFLLGKSINKLLYLLSYFTKHIASFLWDLYFCISTEINQYTEKLMKSREGVPMDMPASNMTINIFFP